MTAFAEEFRAYVSQEPADPWQYAVDDFGITYGPGSWPWYRFQQGTKENGWKNHVSPGSIRLAPDDTYEAGDQRYVLVWPNEDESITLDLAWMTRPQGLGGVVRSGSVDLDAQLQIKDLPSDLPPDVHQEIESRVEKFRQLLKQARAERDSGIKQPATMYDKWLDEQAVVVG
jgi:hypothetical protein